MKVSHTMYNVHTYSCMYSCLHFLNGAFFLKSNYYCPYSAYKFNNTTKIWKWYVQCTYYPGWLSFFTQDCFWILLLVCFCFVFQMMYSIKRQLLRSKLEDGRCYSREEAVWGFFLPSLFQVTTRTASEAYLAVKNVQGRHKVVSSVGSRFLFVIMDTK